MSRDFDYLDDILGTTVDAGIARKDDDPRETFKAPESLAVQRPRQRFTVQLSTELIEELRNAVVFLLMAGEGASIAGLVETAIVEYVEQLRDKHRGGQPFPPRPFKPPVGRRLLREPPAG